MQDHFLVMLIGVMLTVSNVKLSVLFVSTWLGYSAQIFGQHYSRCFCQGVLEMKLTFKLVDFE